MTQSQTHPPHIETGDGGHQPDIEMPDADTARAFASNTDLPPRPGATHFQSYTAATVVTAAGEKFLQTFWKRTRPDMQQPCPNCAPEPPPHQTILQHVQTQPPVPPVHELPALPQTPTEEDPLTPAQDEITAFAARETELLEQINQLKADLANAPSPDSVRAVERSLQAEIALREKAQQEVRQKNSDLDVLRKRWKAAARELDKSRSQNQGFYQVTDNYLIELTTRLRYNIRNFAIQYFGGELKAKPKLDTKPKNWDVYMAANTPTPQDCERFLLSDRRPSIIQAYLWRFLVTDVFDCFRWAGDNAITMRNMCRLLRPDGQYSSSTTPLVPDEERKFQLWLANTTAVVLDAGNAPSKREETTSQVTRRVASLVDKMREIIDHFAVSKDAGYTQELTRILEEAVSFDMEIHRQVARVQWIFPQSGQEMVFDKGAMRLEAGEIAGKEKELVKLVVCAGMKKRGKSTGELDGFAAPATWLVPMEVSCAGPPELDVHR
ncbi:hypothetical protein BJY04DRAFT_26890 [Aspergillus karnatakaensis]|uniref:uncharacterized protein n=1 Tax=Aspergillus karnatakaensis TaxID=1810916 RepID=UPI003CCD0276